MLVFVLLLFLFIGLLLFMDGYPRKFRKGRSKPKVVLIGGVHGNEPAGSEALKEVLRHWHIRRGTLVVFPEVNEFGLIMGTRYNLSLDPDINRNYYDGGRCAKSKSIMNEIANADLVVDLHEGWGFHKINKESIGSTISPSSSPFAKFLANKCIKTLNRTLASQQQFESLLERGCEIKNSLACHCERSNIPYLLVETTGQNDIQPLELRKKQHLLVLRTVLETMGMV